jgi:hypothetical protein
LRFTKPKGWWGKRPAIPSVLLGAASAVCLAVAGITGIASFQSSADMSSDSALADRTMDGKTVKQDPVMTASSTAAPTSSAPAIHVPAVTQASLDSGQFSVPAVGLEVPLEPLSAEDGEINPPGFSSAYWIANMGVPLSQSAEGTVFVVMHSVRGGGVAPGNYLTDIQAGTSTVPEGSTIDVAGVSYRVTGWRTIPKGGLATDSEVWSDTPGRLVVITCLEYPDGSPSTDNMVITASLA